MTWWLIPSIIGVVFAGIAVGLLISLIILKARKQNLPFSLRKAPALAVPAGQHPNSVNTVKLIQAPVKSKEKMKPVTMSEPAKPEKIKPNIISVPSRRETIQPIPISNPGKPAELLTEIEKNLVIATQPVSDHLPNFFTDAWNSHRSKLDLIDQTLKSDLTEAYVDMLLANNLVWLTTELKRDSRDLTASYVKLKDKVAERLQRIMPQIRKEFQTGK